MSIVRELGAGYAQQLEHCEYDGAFKKIVLTAVIGSVAFTWKLAVVR